MKDLSPRYVEGMVKEAMKGALSTGQAAARLGCTKQYVNKLKRRYAAEGSSAFVHGNAGKSRRWRPPPKEVDFYLSVRYERRLGNGCSFAMFGKRLQMRDGNGRTLKAIPGSEIDVYVTPSGQIMAVYDGTTAEVKDATLEPKEAKPKKPGRPKWRPGPNHSWRRFVINYKKGGN